MTYAAKRPAPWEAVYQQTQRWARAGCFEAIVHDLWALLRVCDGRKAQPTAMILDSRTLHWTPESDARAVRASCCCPGAGWSNAVSHGRLAFDASLATMNVCLKHSPISISSPLPA